MQDSKSRSCPVKIEMSANTDGCILKWSSYAAVTQQLKWYSKQHVECNTVHLKWVVTVNTKQKVTETSNKNQTHCSSK